jgi:adenylate cyclase class 2
MTANGQEIEVKFYLRDQPALQQRLLASGAQAVQARVLETNLRFDTPEHSLSQAGNVLRLRQDTEARVTYKGAGGLSAGARLRVELEYTVGDFGMARRVFEALGYAVYMTYEKYRATYALGEVLVTLDEMPYGNFAEIEGPDGETIQRAAAQLGLDWEARNLDSYTLLFENVKQALGLDFDDLTFANFTGLQVTPQALGVRAAD